MCNTQQPYINEDGKLANRYSGTHKQTLKFCSEMLWTKRHMNMREEIYREEEKKTTQHRHDKNRLTNNSYNNDKHCATIMMAYPIPILLVPFRYLESSV